MQGRRDSKSRLNSAAQHMLINNTSLRENTDIRRLDPSNKLEDLQLELQQKEMTIAALQRNYEGLSKVYKDEKGKSTEWVEKVAGLEKENSILRGKIQTFESQKQKALQDLEKTQEEVMKLLKGYEEVRGIKTESVTIKIMYEKKKKECEEYYNKSEGLRTENDVLKKVKFDLEILIKKSKADLEGVDKELKKVCGEYEEYKENTVALESRYAEALNELDFLRTEMKKKGLSDGSLENIITALKQQAAVDKLEISSLRGKNLELSEVISSLRQHLELKESKSSNTEKNLKDSLKELNSKIQALTTENSQLKIKLEFFLDIEKTAGLFSLEVEELKKQLILKNEEMERWKNEAKSMNDNLNFVLSNSEKKHKELEEEIRLESARKLALIDQSEQARDLLSKKEQEFKEYMLSQTEQSKDALYRKEKEFKDYLNLKESSLADCKAKLQEYAKNLEDLTKENQRIKETSDEANKIHLFTQQSLQQSIEETSKYKQSLSKLLTEVEKLKKRLIEETSNRLKSNELELELQEKSQQIQILTQSISSLTSENSFLSTSLKSLESNVSSLSSELSSKSSELISAQSLIKSLQSLVDSNENEKKSLNLSKNHLESEVQKLHKLISSLSKDLQDCKEEVKKEKELRAKFEVQLSGKEMEVARFENLLMIEKSNYKNSVEDNANLLRRVQEIKEDRDRIRAVEEESLKRIKSVGEKEKALEKVLKRVENALESLETNLTCHSCFAPLEGATICVPCGHLNCGNCKPSINSNCKECEGLVKQTMAVSRFDEIYGKIVYKKQAISDMKYILNPI